MGSSVQARSKMRRRSSRSSFAWLRHLKPVMIPKPSKRHPIAGIWVAEIDEDEFEVISVSYDCLSTNAAMIVGTKLAGAGFHEPGAPTSHSRVTQGLPWVVGDAPARRHSAAQRDERALKATPMGPRLPTLVVAEAHSYPPNRGLPGFKITVYSTFFPGISIFLV